MFLQAYILLCDKRVSDSCIYINIYIENKSWGEAGQETDHAPKAFFSVERKGACDKWSLNAFILLL